MNRQTNSQANFEADYQILQLMGDATWETTRVQYRKQVHYWHPDKYTDRPDELEDAQQQFIALSKSYNRLKAFYSLHSRLPFENREQEQPTPDATLNVKPVKTSNKSRVDPNNLDIAPLARDERKSGDRLGKNNSLTKVLWTLVASAVIGGTVLLFFILDRKANQKNIAIGRQALREAPTSEFTPTPSEIRRGSSKGAFIRD